ncbi:RnfABCDGE type electron transport complex subunit G [Pseudomonas hefeiensis]|uniref:Ion-translocating oxidoreductase complex subunit G n=1 Tax=Pseudomonas hefeiensis TaxID=2738125 RepID=A0ABY9GEF1_9PSED|nr:MULTISPECIES: RnfABCDGE type electron transport complex subunit G [unclassified Pseudomonas]WLH13946.1 RnfABCDGE type electron transport complex subunit G [Pseudomonas sp. FP205]WLH96999.1 RnfABCDGE type electron transport complex subunit G [Pseudomonas sp. FP53]WLI41275.1 RnfABCDGE type electron transport complex subunit G [Pseudomonas sp. FP821]
MKNDRGVAILALLIGLGTGATYLVQLGTAERIKDQQQAIANRVLLEVLPADRYDNRPLGQPVVTAPVTLAHSTLLRGYLATRAGQPSAVLLRSQALGYEGSIELLVAIDPQGRLLGVKTLRQSETPGLGAAIAGWPNAWLQTFNGKSLQAPTDSGWALKKDQGQFDQLAGATVTSRSVLQAIHDALRYFDEHKAQLTGVSIDE